MKKKFILGLATLLTLASCGGNNGVDPTIVAPSGTPAIAIANYAANHKENVEIVAGPQPLIAAFTAEEKDIVIAPINLGAQRYNAKPTYGFYRTLIWDNIYLVSRNEISDITSLSGANIISWGKGSTPQIVLDTVLNHYDVTADITYLDNVAAVNAMYAANEADIIISAQPNVSSLDTSASHVYALKDYWKEATGLDTYPQSGLFVKIDRYDVIKDALNEIDQEYDKILENVEKTAKNGAELTGMNENLLKNAIPNCGYKTIENEKELVIGYYQAMIDLGLGKALGDKLPDENFYLKK